MSEASSPHIDDIALAADGSILAAPRRQLLLRTDGQHEVIAKSADVSDSTVVRFGHGENTDEACVSPAGAPSARRHPVSNQTGTWSWP